MEDFGYTTSGRRRRGTTGGVDGETGIDGLRRGVRWSRVREGSGGDPSGMVRVCLDGDWMSNGYDTLGMLPSW